MWVLGDGDRRMLEKRRRLLHFFALFLPHAVAVVAGGRPPPLLAAASAGRLGWAGLGWALGLGGACKMWGRGGRRKLKSLNLFRLT